MQLIVQQPQRHGETGVMVDKRLGRGAQVRTPQCGPLGTLMLENIVSRYITKREGDSRTKFSWTWGCSNRSDQ